MASSTKVTSTTTANHSTRSTDEASHRHHHDWHDATITSLTQLTPTVTGITLMVDVNKSDTSTPSKKTTQKEEQTSSDSRTRTPFIFQPGQWVDFYIPSLNEVGGYSITSLPSHLPRLELAVKKSNHPPALWVTTQSNVGDCVKVRVGGTFTYRQNKDDDNHSPYAVLFIAGGVGINPLYGMLRQLHEDIQKKNEVCGNKVVLLYSASTRNELLFQSQLSNMQHEFPSIFKMIYFVTKENNQNDNGEKNENNDPHTRNVNDHHHQELVLPAINLTYGRRITSKDIGDVILEAGGEHVSSVYICGPPGMAEQMTNICLKDHGISRCNIHFEQWW